MNNTNRPVVLTVLIAVLSVSGWSAAGGGRTRPGFSGAAGEWITRGFEAFSRGEMGNSGQNIYVSRQGVLQRIHRFDFNLDGYPDVLVCNSHDTWEKPDAGVYGDVFGNRTRRDVPADGAVSGALRDLNGDGYDDLVLAMKENGLRPDLNAFVYFGDAPGLSERRRVLLPAPGATSVASGDFNGDGRPDIVFALARSLRVFYQNSLAFEPRRFADLPVPSRQLAATDLDADGTDDLFVLNGRNGATVLWGGAGGLLASNSTRVEVPEDGAAPAGAGPASTESRTEAEPLARVLRFGGVPHVTLAQASRVLFFPVARDRTLGTPVQIACPRAVSAAAGDINGNGLPDLVFASRSVQGQTQASWVYWDLQKGLEPTRRTPLPTAQATDVALSDLDGDGLDDVVVCQERTPEFFTFHSLAFRGSKDGSLKEPVQLETHSARRVLIGRTSAARLPEIVFVNRLARGAVGDVPAYLYLGGAGKRDFVGLNLCWYR